MHPQPAKSKSTGPTTDAGKRISSQNALRHGLASRTRLIDREDPAEYAALEQALFDQFQPANPTETLLVYDLVQCQWLKNRAIHLQGEALLRANPGEVPPNLHILLRYQTNNERAFHRALNTLITLQQERTKPRQEFVSQKPEPKTQPRPQVRFSTLSHPPERPEIHQNAPNPPAPTPPLAQPSANHG